MNNTWRHPAILALLDDPNIDDPAAWKEAFMATGHFRDGQITDTGMLFDFGGDGDIHEVETDQLAYLVNALERLACMADHDISPDCWQGKGGVRYLVGDWQDSDKKHVVNAGTSFHSLFDQAMSGQDMGQNDLCRLMFYLAGASAKVDRKEDGILLTWDNPDDLLVEETVEIHLEPDALKGFFLECLAAWTIPKKYRDNRDQVHLAIAGWRDRPEK